MLAQDEQVILGVVQKGQCGEPCSKLENMMAKLMTKMDGFFQAGIVDIRTQIATTSDGEEKTVQTLFNITNIPMILIYRYGAKQPAEAMMLTQETMGQLIGAYDIPQHQKQVHDTFLQFLPTKVERINRGNMKEWMSKSDNKARVLLVTKRTVTPAMFTKLSLNHPGVAFGELRESDPGALEELATLGGPKVAKFPSLLFGKAMKDGWAAPSDVYAGALNLQAIGAGITKIDPGIHIPELLGENTLTDACTSKGGICVVAVLPAKFTKHLEAFKSVAARWWGENNLAHFVWVNEEKQEKWVEAFKVEYFPGVVVLNARKKLYATHVGTFNAENLYPFITKVMAGKEKLTGLDSMPKLLKVDKTMPPLNMKEL